MLFESITSIGIDADTRPRAMSSEDHRSATSRGMEHRDDIRPDAGLRNFASSFRTTGTKPCH